MTNMNKFFFSKIIVVLLNSIKMINFKLSGSGLLVYSDLGAFSVEVIYI